MSRVIVRDSQRQFGHRPQGWSLANWSSASLCCNGKTIGSRPVFHESNVPDTRFRGRPPRRDVGRGSADKVRLPVGAGALKPMLSSYIRRRQAEVHVKNPA